MSAVALTLREWCEAVVAEVNATALHPAAAATIHLWLAEMMGAADLGDTDAVERRAVAIRDKIAQEREWYG